MGARVPFRMRSAPLPLRTSAAREPPRGRRGTRIANPWKHVESLLPHASPAPHVLIFDLRRRTAVSPRPTAAAILCPPRNNDSFAKKSNHCPPADRLPVLRGETRCPDGGDLFQPLSASGLAFRSASPSARRASARLAIASHAPPGQPSPPAVTWVTEAGVSESSGPAHSTTSPPA